MAPACGREVCESEAAVAAAVVEEACGAIVEADDEVEVRWEEITPSPRWPHDIRREGVADADTDTIPDADAHANAEGGRERGWYQRSLLVSAMLPPPTPPLDTAVAVAAVVEASRSKETCGVDDRSEPNDPGEEGGLWGEARALVANEGTDRASEPPLPLPLPPLLLCGLRRGRVVQLPALPLLPPPCLCSHW